MNGMQKVIKYLALLFAGFLIFSIVSGILGGIALMTGFFGNDEDLLEETRNLSVASSYENLNIDVSTVRVEIKESDTFRAETNYKYITVKEDQNTLVIREKNRHWFGEHETGKLILYLPEDMSFKDIHLETGAGKLEIDSLTADTLNLDLGAGRVRIQNLFVQNETVLNCGAGEFVVENGSLHNLDLDLGVGSVRLTSKLTGNSEIDAGVGEVNLKLLGTLADYRIEVDKGIGDIEIDGQKVSDHSVTGNGQHKIDINGGVGSIRVDFLEEKGSSNENMTFTKTYQVLNMTKANDVNSYYLTLQLFQGEVDTVLVRDMNMELEVSKNYEFTFSREKNTSMDDTMESIFANAKIVSVKETTKVGNEQVQEKVN